MDLPEDPPDFDPAISVRLGPGQGARLRALAAAHNSTVARVVRHAIQQLLDAEGDAKPPVVELDAQPTLEEDDIDQFVDLLVAGAAAVNPIEITRRALVQAGSSCSTCYPTVREALAAYYLRRGRGPRPARPRWHDGPRSSCGAREDTTWILIGTALHDPECCDVTPGSTLDAEIQAWALESRRRRGSQPRNGSSETGGSSDADSPSVEGSAPRTYSSNAQTRRDSLSPRNCIALSAS